MRVLLRGAATGLCLLFLQTLPPQPRAVPQAQAPKVPQVQSGSVAPDDGRFLVVGLTQDQNRTDTIMVVQWDDLHKQARILSLPRDTGVQIAGIGVTKIVHAYATGGIGRTRVAVSRELGVPIPHYFVFSLPALRHLVDRIGGVSVTVEKRMVYSDRKQGLYINLYPGTQVLDGAHAEQYLRFRHDNEADIGRIRRQQQFFGATLTTIRRPHNWVRLPWIVLAARGEVESDLTSSQLLDWVRRAEGLTPEAISAYTVGGRSVRRRDALERMTLDFWEPDRKDLRAKVHWLLTGEPPPNQEP